MNYSIECETDNSKLVQMYTSLATSPFFQGITYAAVENLYEQLRTYEHPADKERVPSPLALAYRDIRNIRFDLMRGIASRECTLVDVKRKSVAMRLASDCLVRDPLYGQVYHDIRIETIPLSKESDVNNVYRTDVRIDYSQYKREYDGFVNVSGSGVRLYLNRRGFVDARFRGIHRTAGVSKHIEPYTLRDPEAVGYTIDCLHELYGIAYRTGDFRFQAERNFSSPRLRQLRKNS